MNPTPDSERPATSAPPAGDSTRDQSTLDATRPYSDTPAAGIKSGERTQAEREAASRYQVLRFHAKGGLGTVSVAEDRELRRQVAFKEIQEQYADDSLAQQRFIREAEITGKLEHPGVVPVYGLGSHPDGRPYYAMRFIQGQNLAEAIKRYHSSGKESLEFRQLLKRFVDACNAVAFAHSKGVIHRDLKPANIMLGEYGETLVVDWGLARDARGGERMEAGSESSTESAVDRTRLGNAVGTTGYMPPEQAAGQWDQVGPHSDIYSLGATLYCILTGKPPITGPNALEKAKRGEWISARSANPEVPKALDAIASKAMARESEQRYASVLELASDIDHWLADEPVKAYRESAFERFARWRRSHRALVSTLMAAMTIAVVALTIIVVVINAARRKTEAAKQKTESALNRTRIALDTTTSKAMGLILARKAQLDDTDRDFLRQAIEQYRQFVEEQDGSADSRRAAAAAQSRIAGIRSMLGEKGPAEQASGDAIAAWEALAEESPGDVQVRCRLVEARTGLATLLNSQGRRKQAEPIYSMAIAEARAVVDAHPDSNEAVEVLIDALHDLGTLQSETGRLDQAEAAFAECLSVAKRTKLTPRLQGQVSATQANLAFLFQKTGRLKEADESYAAAEADRRALVELERSNPDQRQWLAAGLRNRGEFLEKTGRLEQAESALNEARRLCLDLTADFPAIPDYRSDLARNHAALAQLFASTGRPGQAAAEYDHAIAILKQLTEYYPAVDRYSLGLALSLNNFGQFRTVTGDLGSAERMLKQSLSISNRLAGEHSTEPAYHSTHAKTLHILADVYGATGRPKLEEEAARAGIAELRRLAEEHREVQDYRFDLAGAISQLGALLQNSERVKEAAECHRECVALYQALADAQPRVPDYQEYLILTLKNQAICLDVLGQQQEAADRRAELVDAVEKLATKFPQVPRLRSLQASIHHDRGISLIRMNNNPEAEKELSIAIELNRRFAREFPNQPEFQMDLSMSLGMRADARASQRKFDQAEADIHEAIEIDRKLVERFPKNVRYQVELAESLLHQAQIDQGRFRLKQMEKPAREAVDLVRKVIRNEPTPANRIILGRALGSLNVALTFGNQVERETIADEAMTLLNELTTEQPNVVDYHQLAASLAVVVGQQQVTKGQHQKARATLEAGLRHLDYVLSANPGYPESRDKHRLMTWILCGSLKSLKDHAALAKAAPTLPKFSADPARDSVNAARFLATAAELARDDSSLPAESRKQLSEQYCAKAVELLGRAKQLGFKKFSSLRDDDGLRILRDRKDFEDLFKP